MLCLSGFELYSRWVPLLKGPQKAIIRAREKNCQRKYNLNQQKTT